MLHCRNTHLRRQSPSSAVTGLLEMLVLCLLHPVWFLINIKGFFFLLKVKYSKYFWRLLLGITHIPETEAVQHLTLDSLLQPFTIRVCTCELHLILHPEQSCSMEEMQKRDQEQFISPCTSVCYWRPVHWEVYPLSTQILLFLFACIDI